VQEQQPEPRVLPPRMTEGVQELTELRRDETTTPEPRVPTAFEQSLRQFMRQENIGVTALAKRLGKSQGSVSEWLSGKSVCSTQAEVLHEAPSNSHGSALVCGSRAASCQAGPSPVPAAAAAAARFMLRDAENGRAEGAGKGGGKKNAWEGASGCVFAGLTSDRRTIRCRLRHFP